MIILKIPEDLYSTLEKFKQSKYGEMYLYKDIQRYFQNSPDTIKVLIKDYNYKLKFVDEVNERFGTNIEDFEVGNYELDFPIKLKEEIFNV
jgi:hypothetical protein